MLMMVTGGAGSGKSSVAESYATALSAADPGKKLYYLATMRTDPADPEMLRKIERHRQMRAGKGFRTMECPCGIGRIVREADCAGEKEDGGRAVYLLEDLPNLIANELWTPEGALSRLAEKSPEAAHRCITEPLLKMAEQNDLIVVTGEVGSDGTIYDNGTEIFLFLLGKVGAALAAEADQVTEVVCGIPLCMVSSKGDAS